MLNEFSCGGMWYSWIFWLVIIVGIIWAVVFIVNNYNRKQQNYFPREEDALEILKKRYARGEISREQFEQMREDLNS
jgi:putative membrane protein